MLNVVFVTFVIFLEIGFAFGGDVNFGSCASAGLADVVTFSVSGCERTLEEEDQICEFVKGQEYTFRIVANYRQHTDPDPDDLPFRVVGTYLGLPFLLAEGDFCNYDINNECANLGNAEGTITFEITRVIPLDLPNIRDIRFFARAWSRQEDVGQNLLSSTCLTIRVSVVNEPSLL